MKFLLVVETDWDFGIEFRGQSYTDSEFSISLNCPSELDDIKLLGPFGSPFVEGNTKCWEFEEGIKAIKANPLESFSNTGGNRGVEWWPLTTREPIGLENTRDPIGLENAATQLIEQAYYYMTGDNTTNGDPNDHIVVSKENFENLKKALKKN